MTKTHHDVATLGPFELPLEVGDTILETIDTLFGRLPRADGVCSAFPLGFEARLEAVAFGFEFRDPILQRGPSQEIVEHRRRIERPSLKADGVVPEISVHSAFVAPVTPVGKVTGEAVETSFGDAE